MQIPNFGQASYINVDTIDTKEKFCGGSSSSAMSKSSSSQRAAGFKLLNSADSNICKNIKVISMFNSFTEDLDGKYDRYPVLVGYTFKTGNCGHLYKGYLVVLPAVLVCYSSHVDIFKLCMGRWARINQDNESFHGV